MNYVLLDKPYVITFVGESGSGKSSIISSYIQKYPTISQTTGLCNAPHTVLTLENNISITVDIWDTHGQQNFRSISNLFIKKLKAVVIVYDTQRNNFYKEAN